jgi:hypothetical protein
VRDERSADISAGPLDQREYARVQPVFPDGGIGGLRRNDAAARFDLAAAKSG